MTTGRDLIQRAMREPMMAKGWNPRAAGWFTRQLTDTKLGVVVVSAASEHYPRGEASVYPTVSLRDDTIETIVGSLTGEPRGKYQDRTVNTLIGYVMPERYPLQWHVSESNADELGAYFADIVEEFGLPLLQRLATDSGEFLRWDDDHFFTQGASNICRRAVILELHGQRDRALAFLTDRESDAAGGGKMPWAVAVTSAVTQTREWIRSRPLQ